MALRVGIVGLRRGAPFIPHFNAHPHARVSAICDINPSLLHKVAGQHLGVSTFSDYQQMLQSDVDAVFIATPLTQHSQQAEQALWAGKHVLSEVTPADSLPECYRLIQAVLESGCKYMLAENYCYIRENVLVGEMIKAGKFGKVYFAEGEYVHDCKHLYWNADGSYTWRGKLKTTRNGDYYITHSLGPLYRWFQEPATEVCCLGTGVHTVPEFKTEDTVIVLCKTASGKLWKIRHDSLSSRPHNMRYYSLQGTKGCYEAPRGPGDWHRVWVEGDAKNKNTWQRLDDYALEFLPERWRNPPAAALSAGHWGSDFLLVQDFVDAVVNDARPPIDVFDAVNMVLPGIMSQVSIARGGRPVAVPEVQRTTSKFVIKCRE